MIIQRRTAKMVFALLLISMSLCAQHKLSFASKNNIIELSVANGSTMESGEITVQSVNTPQWLTFVKTTDGLKNLQQNETSTARFSFSVDKSAPVNKPYKIEFTVSTVSGEQWKKEILIEILPPERFELFQNYPNPFNPATTISYNLPSPVFVELKVFDALGKEVATLVNGMKEAGYQEVSWNASNLASGMYICQIKQKGSVGKEEYLRKKMILLK